MESQSDYSTRGCLLGKTVSPRLQQLEDDFMDNGGCFKEFRIGDLFDIHSSMKKFNANSVKFGGKYPYVARGSSNNGIKGYITENPVYLNKGNTISIGQDTGTVYYQQEPYFTGDKIKIAELKGHKLTEKIAIYFIVSIRKKFSEFKWGQNSFNESILLDLPLLLPVNTKFEIDFDYMESYIRELEQERIRELDAYLKATGLNDYELTPKEKNSIEIMSKGGVNWKEFKVLDIFTVKNTQSVMKSQVDFCSGDIPYVTAGETNNSIASYISAEPSIIDKGNCIVIGGKSTVVTYQEQDFVSNDSHNLALYMKETDKKAKYTQMFFVTLLSFKLKQLYNWGNSISNKKIQKDTIHVPVNQNGDIDYQFIELYSKAVEKLCIKSVVLWLTGKIE